MKKSTRKSSKKHHSAKVRTSNTKKNKKEEKSVVPEVIRCTKCDFITQELTAKFCMSCGKPMEKKPLRRASNISETAVAPKHKASKDGKHRFPRSLSEQELLNKKTIDIIEEKTAEFGCSGKVISVAVGPVVTQFNFTPNRFVKVKRVRDLNEDLAMALSADNVAITRLPGQPAVSIMVPNKVRKEISFQETLKNVIAHKDDMALPVNLGFDSFGNPVVIDLATQPHMLIGGSTGSGKSVCANSILTSLLYTRSANQLRLALIDPKHVELRPYEGLPHAKYGIATTVHAALDMLEQLDLEMRRRMLALSHKKVKNLKEYNEKMAPADRLPYVVIVIDELADLIMQERKAVTTALATISSVARAAGIHIIAMTQRPSVDVLSGRVKVNFPARISFRVVSSGDSKTIINSRGAEQLMKCGDAYFLSPERAGLTRIHVPHLQKHDFDRMLDLSLAIGHVHKTPVEATEAEQAELRKQILAQREAEERSDDAVMSDVLDKDGDIQGKKPTIQ